LKLKPQNYNSAVTYTEYIRVHLEAYRHLIGCLFQQLLLLIFYECILFLRHPHLAVIKRKEVRDYTLSVPKL
jgi:hypothetical protein